MGIKKPVESVGTKRIEPFGVLQSASGVITEGAAKVIVLHERILRLPEVISRTGMCKAKIYSVVGFPKPVKVGGRSSGWPESEVDAWVAQTIAEGRAS